MEALAGGTRGRGKIGLTSHLELEQHHRRGANLHDVDRPPRFDPQPNALPVGESETSSQYSCTGETRERRLSGGMRSVCAWSGRSGTPEAGEQFPLPLSLIRQNRACMSQDAIDDIGLVKPFL